MKEIIIDGKKYQCFEETEVCNPFRIKGEYPPKIISLIKKDKSEILRDDENINSWLAGYSKDYWEIYQVATSKTDVWTIGDRVKFQGTGCSDIGIISKFEYKNQELYICSATCEFHWKYVIKAPTPLFTTEDGKEMFEGDCVFVVDSRTYYYYGLMPSIEAYPKSYKFSTKEAANKYIEQNKPRFSVKDIEDLTKELKSQSFKYWDEIIKQKLGI